MFTGAELGAVFTSLSLVYEAYSKIKSNKERCQQLLVRCQQVVDRLQSSFVSNDDDAVRERVSELERTFQLAADTIMKVGQQGWIRSFLRSEENSFLIDDTQSALTQLVAILNLEQTIDISKWQKDYELARTRDHQTLMSIGTRLEEGNSAIMNELTQQGATLNNLTEIMTGLRLRAENSNTSSTAVFEDPINLDDILDETLPRPRSSSMPEMSAPTPTLLTRSRSLREPAIPEQTPSPGIAPRRRWINRISMPPLANLVSRLSARNSSSQATDTQLDPHSSNPRRNSYITDSGNSSQASPSTVTPPSSTPTLVPNDTDSITTTDLPRTPPPAYEVVGQPGHALLDSVVSDENDNGTGNDNVDDNDSDAASVLSGASMEAVRSGNSPPPSPGMSWVDLPFDRPLPPVTPEQKAKAALQKIDIATSGLTSTGPHGYFNKRVLVELWKLPPSMAKIDRAVPLANFHPIHNESLQSVTQRANDISRSLRPMISSSMHRPTEYNHVLMLCPLYRTPYVVCIKKHEKRPQCAVKAYVLESDCEVTLVRVKCGKQRSLFVIPYYPDMAVLQAKELIRECIGKATIKSCRMSKTKTHLADDETLALSGVKPFSNQLRMTLAVP